MEDCKKCHEPLERIQERLNKMLLKLELKQHSSPEQVFFDNQEFIQLMNISKRTAQAWRDTGMIAFTPSGTFSGGRKAELLDQYSGFVHLDFDKLPEVQLNAAFMAIASIPYTFACFRSPSGNGLKVFVEVNSGAEHHDNAYRQVQVYYEKMLGIDSDPKCKDITRLCFVSDDPETYKNIHNQIFEVNISENKSQTKILEEDIHDYQKSFEDCVRFTEQKENYQTGNRNNFVYLLACNCNRSGIPESEALDLIITNFDLSEDEIKASIRSAYSHHFNEFANFALQSLQRLVKYGKTLF